MRKALALLLLLIPSFTFAATVKESLSFVSASKNFVQIIPAQGLVIDLRYASANNFIGQNLYGEFNRAFLHRVAAEKLYQAVKVLQNIHAKYQLVIFDALRPRSVQYILWNKVKGSEKEKYVANPKGGSIHNFGFAVDLSVLDESGKELDMGTAFDDFSSLAQPQLEGKFLNQGKLTKFQIANRKLLRKVMESVGFIQLPLEWWHFDALPKAEVKIKYKIVE